ncbi:hypothetical protein DB346_14775 [Verrucomicrobia bacterium LW23]|nr:hypothetical protein DB346_14775 [Verrucomicrobia bacterium LW23]
MPTLPDHTPIAAAALGQGRGPQAAKAEILWPTPARVLSTDVLRVDAREKVTGEAKYASDVQPPGWLYAMILRSRWAAAKVTAIDTSEALKVPGVKSIVLAGGEQRRVRYYGTELAAVAATSKQACLDALRAIKVTAEPLPFVVDERDAMKEDAPRVFDGPNLSAPGVKQEGDVANALSSAAAVVEGELSTQVQIHHPLESHGNTIVVKDDGATVWASTQGIFSVRDGIAGNLKLPQSNVQVICDYMGGGFGAKFGPGVEGGLAARLSKETGLPVKLMLTRLEEGLAVGNRPSSIQKIKMGASADGKLTAFEAETVGTPGTGGGGETAGGSGGANVATPYIYKVPNFKVQQRAVATNAGASRAFRAPAHPQGSFGTECMLDDLAVKLGIDPVEIRILNDPGENRRKEYALGRDKFGWKEKYKKPGSSPGPIKTGVGCAGATWGGGGRGTRAEAQINSDGTVEVRVGTQDLGTGSRTLVAMVAAEAFGIRPDQVVARIGDTRFPPSGASGGSTTTASLCPGVWDACQNALAELKTRSGMADVAGPNWAVACRKIGINPISAQGEWKQGLSSSGSGGVQFVEVEVDTDTGYIRVKKVLALMDCGLIVNTLTTTSQINSGIIMGMSYALHEERVMDKATGVVLNHSFDTYKITNLADTPEIECILLNMPERGVIGIAEVSNVPTASAIANAVANAIGVRVPSLPITPAKVLAALGKVPKMSA